MLISAAHEKVDVPKWSIRIKAVVMLVFLTVVLLAGVYLTTKFSKLFPLISAGLMLFHMFTATYRMLSFRKRNVSFRFIGGMFTTLGIMGLADLFISIVHNFTSYEDIYGPIAVLVTSLLGFLVFVYTLFRLLYQHGVEEDYGNEEALAMKHAKFFAVCLRVHDQMTKRIIKS